MKLQFKFNTKLHLQKKLPNYAVQLRTTLYNGITIKIPAKYRPQKVHSSRQNQSRFVIKKICSIFKIKCAFERSARAHVAWQNGFMARMAKHRSQPDLSIPCFTLPAGQICQWKHFLIFKAIKLIFAHLNDPLPV